MASGYVPVIKSVKDNEVYKEEYLDLADGGDYITALSVKVGLAQEKAYYTSPAFVGSSTARDQVGTALVFALRGEKTAEQALADAYKNCGGK